MTMTTNDFKAGDILKLKRRDHLDGCEAKVQSVNFNGNGLVTYCGLYCGSGAFDPAKFDNPTRFQTIVGAEKISFRKPWAPFNPQPGNRGYDLMC